MLKPPPTERELAACWPSLRPTYAPHVQIRRVRRLVVSLVVVSAIALGLIAGAVRLTVLRANELAAYESTLQQLERELTRQEVELDALLDHIRARVAAEKEQTGE